MKCEEQRELLDLYMDGELPDEISHRLERHLLRCQSCASELQTLQQTRNLLKGALPATETTSGFRERTMTRLLDRFQPLSRPRTTTIRQRVLPFPADAEEKY